MSSQTPRNRRLAVLGIARSQNAVSWIAASRAALSGSPLPGHTPSRATFSNTAVPQPAKKISDRKLPLFLGTLAGLLLAAAGCGGGSGSSGFSFGDERRVIAEVLATGECEMLDAVTYCPADVDDALGDGRTVDTPFDELLLLGCAQSLVDPALCQFAFTFAATGFAAQTDFAVAVRDFDSDDPWLIDSATILGTPNGDAKVAGSGTTAAVAPGALQIAILTTAGALDATTPVVDNLATTGAELVYVASMQQPAALQSAPENTTIEQVLAARSCQPSGITLLCPTDEILVADIFELAADVPPLLTQTEVSTISDPGFNPICVLNGGTDSCRFNATVGLEGLSGFTARLAVRTREGNDGAGGDWVLSETADLTNTAPAPSGPTPTNALSLDIDVPGIGGGSPTSSSASLQIAVLIEPIAGPEGQTVATLATVAGLYTFVSEPVSVAVVAAMVPAAVAAP